MWTALVTWFRAVWSTTPHQRDLEWIEEEERRQLHEVRERLDRVQAFIDDRRTQRSQAQVPHERRS